MAEQFVASKQLPYVLQSTKLKNFFDSTVDQWFKNEDSVFEKGYIGQRQGRLFDPKKHSYVPEPTVDRYNYQLEPATIVRNADSQTISYQSTYEDLVNKIRFDGGNVKDHSRLFESSYYSYAPPIDIDKYLNYSNYYWYPYSDNLSSETGGAFAKIPSKPIDGTSTTAITLPTDIVGKKKYTAPDGTIFTNGLHVRFEGSYVNGTSYQYFYTVDSLTIATPGTGYAVGDAINMGSKVIGKVSAVNSGAITAIEKTQDALDDGVLPGTVTITSSSGASGVITVETTRTSITFFVEGVGDEIKLIEEFLKQNEEFKSKSKAVQYLVDKNIASGNIKKGCEKIRFIDAKIRDAYLEKFKIYNPIYSQVFNQDWVDKVLVEKYPTGIKDHIRWVSFLLLSLGSFRLLFPQLYVQLNDCGIDNYLAKKYQLARFYFQCALLLKPNYKKAHYNLGATYEKLQQVEKAWTEYYIADEVSQAYNNLARLYIKDEQYSKAIGLLEKAFQKPKAETDPVLRYALLKNMGWVLLEQQRYSEAETYLREAIELMNTRAIAYKLLARLLEAKGDREAARDMWQKFRQYALNESPQEYEY